MNRNGSEHKEIADAIGKHPSTVSRERRRLGEEVTGCHVAADRYAAGLKRDGTRVDADLLAMAEMKLREEQWSPERISSWTAKEGYSSLSHETIYRHVYREKVLGGDLQTHLRHRCSSDLKRGSIRERLADPDPPALVPF